MKYSQEIQDEAKKIVYNMDPHERDLLLWLHLCSLIDESTNSSKTIDMKSGSIYERLYDDLDN